MELLVGCDATANKNQKPHTNGHKDLQLVFWMYAVILLVADVLSSI